MRQTQFIRIPYYPESHFYWANSKFYIASNIKDAWICEATYTYESASICEAVEIQDTPTICKQALILKLWPNIFIVESISTLKIRIDIWLKNHDCENGAQLKPRHLLSLLRSCIFPSNTYSFTSRTCIFASKTCIVVPEPVLSLQDPSFLNIGLISF